MNALLGRLGIALVSLVLAVCGASASAQPPECQGAPSPERLIIEVQGVRNARGYVVGNLYGPDKRKYLVENGWLTVWREPATRGATVICTYLPAPGPYEVVVFHDANANGNLDQGAFGVPTEGYGFSNNVRPFFRAPSLASARFQATQGDTTLRIRLRYP